MTTPRKHSGDQSGFSLVEVLIASVVLIVGITAVIAAFPQAYRTTTDAGRMSVLNHLINEKMEELRSLEITDSDLSIATHPAQANDSGGNKYYPVPGLSEEYSLRWVVSAGPTDGGGTAEPEMRTVVVQATFMTRYTTAGAPLTTERSIEVRSLTYLY